MEEGDKKLRAAEEARQKEVDEVKAAGRLDAEKLKQLAEAEAARLRTTISRLEEDLLKVNTVGSLQ